MKQSAVLYGGMFASVASAVLAFHFHNVESVLAFVLAVIGWPAAVISMDVMEGKRRA